MLGVFSNVNDVDIFIMIFPRKFQSKTENTNMVYQTNALYHSLLKYLANWDKSKFLLCSEVALCVKVQNQVINQS